MKSTPIAALCAALVLSAAARAQDQDKGRQSNAPKAVSGGPGGPGPDAGGRNAPQPGGKATNFRISFKVRAGELSSAGNFVIADRAQSNYTDGGEAPFDIESGKGDMIEYKKHGVIVNCLPTALDGSLVAVGCQFELSGSEKPATAMKVRPATTFQLQTSFIIRRGATMKLVDSADRLVEVTLEEFQP